MSSGSPIDASTFARWVEWSRRDDAFELFVPSDVRVMLAEIERLRRMLGIGSSQSSSGGAP